MRSFLVVMFALACSSPRQFDGVEPAARRDIEQLRVATKRYQTLDSAVAAGYAGSVRDCLVHEHHGAMGFHHVNRGYMDAALDITRPEILLYERTPAGEYRLNGVEFILPYTQHARDA